MLKVNVEVDETIMVRYLEPWRSYHTLEHIYNGLSAIRHLCTDEIMLNHLIPAWWYHDAIYIIAADDNEDRSALLAQDDGYSDVVIEAIRKTKYPNVGSDNGIVSDIINDADLCGLGAIPAIFDHHTRQIRKEFSMFSDETFWKRRVAFFKTLIEQQSPLFKTTGGRMLWEDRAQANIKREIAAHS